MTDAPHTSKPAADEQPFQPESDRVDVRDMHSPIMRELSEPRDGYEPVPVWLMFLFFALIGWGGWYLGAYSGNWDPMVYNETPMSYQAAAAPDQPADPLMLGKRVYNNCIACHRVDGQGGGTYPPLVGSEYVTGDPHRLAAILIHGLQGPVQVNGKTYDSQMPAWGETLTDDQIAHVLTYVRKEFGKGAAPVEPATVQAARDQSRSRRSPWTAAELDAFVFEAPAESNAPE